MMKRDIETVRVEISGETLTRLLHAGQICAAELCCLDSLSKQRLWKLCLKSCAESRRCRMIREASFEKSLRTYGSFTEAEGVQHDSTSYRGLS